MTPVLAGKRTQVQAARLLRPPSGLLP